MAFTVIRVCAMLLVAVLVSSAVPVAAQGLNKADANDFQMFRHNIAVQRNARVCERGAPEYNETLRDLYAQWSEKHRAAIARGESVFRQALKLQDPKQYPSIDRVTLSKVEQGLAELAQPAQKTGPTAAAAQTGVACERLVTFLKQN
jgi:hypothetical protein